MEKFLRYIMAWLFMSLVALIIGLGQALFFSPHFVGPEGTIGGVVALAMQAIAVVVAVAVFVFKGIRFITRQR